MDSVTRIARHQDHETSTEVRARFGALVVAYFVRAIDSLSDLPKGPELALRRVWTEHPPMPTADRPPGSDRPAH